MVTANRWLAYAAEVDDPGGRVITFRLGRFESDAPVIVKAHRYGVHLILHEGLFSEEQVAILNAGTDAWLDESDAWQLWHGEIVDLREVGPEPELKAREPAQ
ncbi:hypothetical protein ACIQNG_25460 [Streptomyces sp. NPDC091377]|uniref:hypothetical protein n=1 Tax=Streptomyces sp. NPDC091377 TaxID=3365995 RepID=UPI00382A4206